MKRFLKKPISARRCVTKTCVLTHVGLLTPFLRRGFLEEDKICGGILGILQPAGQRSRKGPLVIVIEYAKPPASVTLKRANTETFFQQNPYPPTPFRPKIIQHNEFQSLKLHHIRVFGGGGGRGRFRGNKKNKKGVVIQYFKGI